MKGGCFNLLLPAFLFLLSACGGSSNSMPLNIGNCGVNTYVNEPCVTVKVCSPGTSNCVSVPNVVLDTGSYGLRVFASLVTVPLKQVTNSTGQSIAECASFAQQTSDWGGVEYADIGLGGETAPTVPIQLINSAFPGYPGNSACPNPDTSPGTDGYNGIMGVGPAPTDCGTACVSSSATGQYFACSGSTCVGSPVALALQVTNPISLLPTDNNGVSITLPAINANGTSSVTGTVVFGIGTQSNNKPSGVQVFPSDSTGNFITIFNGTTYTQSYLDTGSNALFFPAPSTVAACSSSSTAANFYCPAAAVNFTATQEGLNRTPVAQIPFGLINAQTAFSTSSQAFNDIGGTSGDGSFDWGLPFFFGRTVYVGIQGKTSSIGTGPFWAY